VDSFWQTDRLVGPLPFLESISVLAAVAGRTERLKFGMNVIVLPFRDPLVLAKECATIDFLSGGRLLPAFGVGREVSPEFAATGRSPDGRGTQADEALQIMARLWSEERVTFQGRYYQYREARIEPKPVQQPLPLWIGGDSPAAIRRTARYGTGWLAGLATPERVAPVVAAIKAAAAEAGRTIDADHYGAGFAFRFGAWDDPIVERSGQPLRRLGEGIDPRRYFAVGDAAAILSRLQEYQAAGVSKFVLRPLAEGDAEIFAQTQRLLEEVLPVVHAQGAPAPR
jgi:probable F420-dependent oxidoreductase